MAISSVGYSGTVDYPDYGIPLVVPGMYTLRGDSASGEAGAFRPSRVTGGSDRTVRVAGGTAVGYGITDTESDPFVDVQLEPVSSGSRWDEIVLRRDWSEKKTTLTVIQGGSGGPPDLPIRNKKPGILDDQPIAYARVQAGEQYVTEVIDLRCWASDGGLVAVDTLALSYLQNHIGTRVTIGDTTYTRIVSPGGAVSWDVKGPPNVQTGYLEPWAPNAHLWSRNLVWKLDDHGWVSLVGRPVRVSGAGGIGSAGSRIYQLPSLIRPGNTRIATAISPRHDVTTSATFPIYFETDGRVVIYDASPSEPVTGNASYQFSITYPTY